MPCSSKLVYLLCVEKYKAAVQKQKPEIKAPTQNEELELPDGFYSVSDIQDFLDYIIKNIKH